MLTMVDDRKLIALVKELPILYNPGHKSYIDNAKKVQVWRDISRKLKLNPSDYSAVRRRWNSIRDNYRKSLKRINKYSKIGKEITFYKYAEELEFIQRYISLKDEGSLQNSADTRDSLESVEEADPSAFEYQEVPSNAQQCVGKMEPTYEDGDIVITDCVGGAAALAAAEGGDGTHPVDAFLACIRPMLKALPYYYLSLARSEIFATVHKYELRTLSAPSAPGHNVSSTDSVNTSSTQ